MGISRDNNRRELKSWWTVDTEAELCKGRITTFGFFNRFTVFKMWIDELVLSKTG